MPRVNVLLRSGLLLLGLWAAVPARATGTVWLLAPDESKASAPIAIALRTALVERGVVVRDEPANRWIPPSDPSDSGDIVLLLPGAVLPPDSGEPLASFLRQGNHLLCLSSAAFSALRPLLVLESISPPYKTYPTRADRLRLPDRTVALAAETALRATLPRARGLGSGQVSPARLIVAAEAIGADGQPRGAAAHLYLNVGTAYAGSVWGGIGLSPEAIAENQPVSAALALDLIERIRRGLFLADAGPGRVAYSAGEKVSCGADLVNLGGEPRTAVLSIELTHAGRKAFAWSESVTIPAHSVARPTHAGPPPIELAAGQYQVETTIHQGDRPVDEISCPLQVLAYAPVPSREVVGVAGGTFVLDGRPWHPLGMNYWPHLSVGLEPGDFSRLWLSPGLYDPDVVERDLTTAEQLGLNLLSIQYSDPEQAPGLMDFMARAERHHLKVNVYLSALEPRWPDLARAQRMIREAHLPESPAFFAYDACWEGHLGPAAERRASDASWQAWVVERYGSVAAAEQDWRYLPLRVAGTLSGPTDEQLHQDGEWRVFVAAYRRFWDDEISRRYRAVRQAVRAVDPLHLLGARSGYGGNGTPMYADLMPFDLAAGAAHLDFISPEGYALQGGREQFLRGGLTAAYARLVGAGKPVFWAEYGVPLRWQVEPGQYHPVETAEMEPQRVYFQNMLRFVHETGGSGCAGWWWPGGYRVDEKSDFGIVNPDGTLRPAARELQQAASVYAGPWPNPPTDHLIEIDRDQFVDGYAGIYTAKADAYVKEFLGGRTPGVRTAGTGTTSADTPPLAVGNVPWNGHNPPKYLNAEFARVEVRAGHEWRRVANGETLPLAAGPAQLRVVVTNTAEARWLPPGGELEAGGIFLEVHEEGGRVERQPLPEAVAYLGETAFPSFAVEARPGRTIEVVLELAAEKRTTFGEKFHLRMEARAEAAGGGASR